MDILAIENIGIGILSGVVSSAIVSLAVWSWDVRKIKSLAFLSVYHYAKKMHGKLHLMNYLQAHQQSTDNVVLARLRLFNELNDLFYEAPFSELRPQNKKDRFIELYEQYNNTQSAMQEALNLIMAHGNEPNMAQDQYYRFQDLEKQYSDIMDLIATNRLMIQRTKIRK